MSRNAQSPSALLFYQGRRFKIWMVALTGFAIIVFAGILRSVTTSIMVSLVIAYVLDPLVWLGRRRLHRCFGAAPSGFRLAFYVISHSAPSGVSFTSTPSSSSRSRMPSASSYCCA